MLQKELRTLILLAAVFAPAAMAQSGSRMPWEQYGEFLQTRQALATQGPTLFGDDVDLYSGSLSFSATDVSMPGNALPVEIGRSYRLKNKQGYPITDLPFGDWDLELPRLEGVFTMNTGWASSCSGVNLAPDQVANSQGTIFRSSDYWQGVRMVVPGKGSQQVLVPAAGSTLPKPTTGGAYTRVTSELTYFSCLPSQANATAEGFLAVTPDGVKYRFDWQAQYMEPTLNRPLPTGGASVMGRRKAVLYASRVEDRFGNWVKYTYSNAANQPARLLAIESSDGRLLSIAYNAGGQIASITNGPQTWTYTYQPAGTGGQVSLKTVGMPDGSQWTLNLAQFTNAAIWYEETTDPDEIVRTCGDPGRVASPTDFTGTVTHPSGAVGQFDVSVGRTGRSNVPMVCNNYTKPNNNPNDDVALYALAYDDFVLARKVVTGPGLATAEWRYNYGGTISFAPGTGPVCTSGDCSLPTCTADSCAGSTVTVVHGPESSWTRYTFGNSYRYNEGKLLKTERGIEPGVVQETETLSYLWPVAGQPFAAPVGNTQQPRGDGYTSEYLRPSAGKVINRDGVDFSSRVNQFDAIARPLSNTRSSSLGYSRTDTTLYYDDLQRWVLGQSARSTNVETGAVESAVDFEAATALPSKTYRFGAVQQSFTYRADGMLATVTDANGRVSTITGWKLGMPQAIVYPDATGISAVIDDLGWIRQVSDENGAATSYTYDAAGRINGITYPVETSGGWNPASLFFEQVGTAEYGLPAGHWRMRREEGNKRSITYFDALWRPVLEEQFDAADPAGTATQVVKRYDGLGRVAFQSYPLRGAGDYRTVSAGTRTRYDGLGRVVAEEHDSELGVLTTNIAYLSGFQRRTTNPRGNVTTERFQAFDEPGYDFPVLIDMPAGSSTVIVRDLFGKPTEIRRTGPES